MRIRLFVLILAGLVICSCGNNDQKANETTLQTKPQQQPIANSNSDTLLISAKSAVFFQPDSSVIAKRIEEDDFRAGADDYIYYINESADYLEKQGLPVIDAKGRKYIKFIWGTQSTQLVKLDTLPDMWGMFLFDAKQPPLYAEIVEIENDYKKYFQQ